MPVVGIVVVVAAVVVDIVVDIVADSERIAVAGEGKIVVADFDAAVAAFVGFRSRNIAVVGVADTVVVGLEGDRTVVEAVVEIGEQNC